jgi:hypothetical protein
MGKNKIYIPWDKAVGFHLHLTSRALPGLTSRYFDNTIRIVRNRWIKRPYMGSN